MVISKLTIKTAYRFLQNELNLPDNVKLMNVHVDPSQEVVSWDIVAVDEQEVQFPDAYINKLSDVGDVLRGDLTNVQIVTKGQTVYTPEEPKETAHVSFTKAEKKKK